MSIKKFTVGSLINTLRETEVLLVRGQDGQTVCRTLGMADQTYYRLSQMDGGLKVDQAKCWKDIEWENARLKHAVADLTVDKLNLKEAAEGNF